MGPERLSYIIQTPKVRKQASLHDTHKAMPMTRETPVSNAVQRPISKITLARRGITKASQKIPQETFPSPSPHLPLLFAFPNLESPCRPPLASKALHVISTVRSRPRRSHRSPPKSSPRPRPSWLAPSPAASESGENRAQFLARGCLLPLCRLRHPTRSSQSEMPNQAIRAEVV